MNDKPRILFVDDEALLLEGIRRTFHLTRRHEWDMFFETDPLHAINMQQERPYDVVITDFMMPALNGIELAKKMHDICEDTQIVMLTGAADLTTAANVINSTKVFRFFTKPCAMDVLEKGITECLEQRKNRQAKQAFTQPPFSDEVLNQLSIGVIICEKNAHVIYMNQFAAEICATQKVLRVDQSNILRTARASEREEFFHCLTGNTHKDRAISLIDQETQTSVSIIVSNIRRDGEERVMLLISDPQKHVAPSVDILQSIYNLPPSEARILHNIVQGHSLQETAEKMNITESSARTYLKRVFSKTNTKSQPELVRSVLLTPALYRQG